MVGLSHLVYTVCGRNPIGFIFPRWKNWSVWSATHRGIGDFCRDANDAARDTIIGYVEL